MTRVIGDERAAAPARPARRRRAATRCSSSPPGRCAIGISARLAKVAFAQAFDVPVEEVEEYWHGLAPPYAPLFAWAADGAPPPDTESLPLFRPFMLAHPLEDGEARSRRLRRRVEVGRDPRAAGPCSAARRGVYSRSGDDVTGTFPEMADALDDPGGARRRAAGARQRTRAARPAARRASTRCSSGSGARPVSAKMLAEYPAFVRLYDVLILEGEDLRELPWERAPRAARSAVPRLPAERFDLSASGRGRPTSPQLARNPRRRARRGDRGADAQAARSAPTSPGAAPGCGTSGSATRCWSTAC